MEGMESSLGDFMWSCWWTLKTFKLATVEKSGFPEKMMRALGFGG